MRNNSRKKLGLCEREIAYVLYKIKLQVSNGEIEKSSMYLNALVNYFKLYQLSY